MRVGFAEDRCAATGICESLAPEVFEVGDDGWLVVRDPEPPESLRAAVTDACESCPTGALTLDG